MKIAGSSFRTIIVLVTVLVLVWISLTVSQYVQTKRQIRQILHGQAEDMAAALMLGEKSMARVLKRLEEEQAAKLLTAGYWLRDLEQYTVLNQEVIQRIAKETGAFNIVLFDPGGERSLALRGGPAGRGAPAWAGGSGRGRSGRGRGMHHANVVKTFLESGRADLVEGMHQGGWFGSFRFSVFVRRVAGGAILINTDLDAEENLPMEFGPKALLTEFAERPEIVYIRRIWDGDVDLNFGVPPEKAAADSVFEITIPIPGEGALLAGFDNRPIQENETMLFQRLLVSAGVALSLGFLAILWMRLQKQHLELSQLLQQVKSYHRTVLEKMEDAVVAWDEREQVIFWNPKAERLFAGLKTGTIDAALQQAMQAAEEHSVLDLEEDGAGRRRFRAEKARIEEPFPAQLLFLADVTAVEEATREHDRREHVEALARVASGVAHEVRNPLNAIDMTIQTLCMDPSDLPLDSRETLEGLRSEIGRINKIIEHFLAYGRPQLPVFDGVDLQGILQEVAAFLCGVAQEKHLIIVVEEGGPAMVRADAQQVKQAVLNIALNAVEASPEQSQIHLRIRNREGQTVCVCEDQGCGMTEEQLESLFDPYVTHKPGGTGLGMSIVKRIMENHGGSVSAASQAGKGTVMELRFPERAEAVEGTS